MPTSTQQLILAGCASVVIAIAGSHARAAGGTTSRPIGKIMSRTVDQSVPMPCPGGSVEERIAESEGVPGFTYDYALGCMVDASHAIWVIRAGLACYDAGTDQAIGNKPARSYCDDPLVRALPAFDVSGDFWDQKIPPYTMHYQLIKYAVGMNCRKVDQPVHYEPRRIASDDRTISVWLCERLNAFDGMLNAAGSHEVDPRLFHTKEILTSSSKRLEFDRDGGVLEPMLGFLVPTTEYDCNVHLAGKRQLVCD